TSETALRRNRDYFVVVTYDGGTSANGLNIYINGVKEASPSRGTAGTFGTAYSSDDLRLVLGKSLLTALPFGGNLGHWMCFDKELSEAEVSGLYNSGTLYDYSSNETFVSNGLLYFPLTETFDSHDGAVELTASGAQIVDDGFDVNSDRLSVQVAEVGNIRYVSAGNFYRLGE